MKLEIIIGLIAIGVIGAVFIPLAFDPAGTGGIDFIECGENEIIKYQFVNQTLEWNCAVDDNDITEIELGSFANENTEFRPHLVTGTNVQDPIKDFGGYSIRVMEFLPDDLGEVSWDYLVPKDYEVGEDLEFTVYWFKEDGLPDTSVVSHYNEESTACSSTTSTATPLVITDGVEYDFEAGETYLIVANTAWGNAVNHEGLSKIELRHGATPFDGSTQSHVIHTASPLPCTTDEPLYQYFYWTLWTPTAPQSLENISIHVDNTDNLNETVLGAILYDDTTISVLKLSDHFTDNVDYFHNENTVDTIILNTWATGNQATISFTPTENNSDWLVLGSNQNVVTTSTYSYETRLQATGGVADTLPFISRQGEAQGLDIFGQLPTELDIHSFARVFMLPNNTSTTFKVQTQVEDGQVNPADPVKDNRLQNQVLAINLETFTQHAWVWTPDSLQLTNAGFAHQLDTVNISSTTSDKRLFVLSDVGVLESPPNLRTQLDNVDVLPDETTQSYNWESDINAQDVGRWALSTISDPVSIGVHTLDIDGGHSGGKNTQFVSQRTLATFLLEAETVIQPIHDVCMEVRLMSVDVGEDLSTAIVPTFGAWKEVCATTTGGADILRTLVFTFNSTENPFEPEEVGMVQLKRYGDNSTSDDYTGKVFGLFGELQWVVLP